MPIVGPNSVADLFFQLKWTTGAVRHTDAYSGRQVNLWRDLLPMRLYDALVGHKPGDALEIALSPGELLGNFRSPGTCRLASRQFSPERIGAGDLQPRRGRFYPKGVLKDVAGIFRENMEPFRVLAVDNSHLDVDLGHPLADRTVALGVTVGTVIAKKEERGGGMRDWGEIITRGVGMQAPLADNSTDFGDPEGFDREDDSPDDIFYEKPRLVQHLDDTALAMVQTLYDRFLHPGMRVLDLMASWDSHLPADTPLAKVTGIGLNADELAANKALTDYRVHDLNRTPVLDIPPHSYDAAVCTASVEYLTDPVAVLAQVGRVLAPGGHFIVTFSNRWFPPKAIRLWSRLHEFERLGLVLDFFRRSGVFTDLQTYSLRGLDRPRHDKYHGRLWQSDPLFAVWGRKR